MRRAWAVAAATVVLYILIGLALQHASGLAPSLGADSTQRWQGGWRVAAGAYDLLLDNSSDASWTIDDVVALKTPGGRKTRTVWLAGGWHRIDVRATVASPAEHPVVAAARAGQPPKPLAPETLAPVAPEWPWLRALATAVRTGLGWATVVAVLWALRQTFSLMWRRLGRARSVERATPRVRPGQVASWAVLAAILAYGGLLRIDAIGAQFDLTGFPLLRALEERSFAPPESIRPHRVSWTPAPLYGHRDGPSTHYHSDPYTYLAAARAMTSFYTAHWREPVFPFATRLSLDLLNNQDVAVSFASTAFSLSAVWLTYILGAAIWSRPVGLLAALALSLDIDVVSLASRGWRDDAYMAAFVMCAYLMVRYIRTADAGVSTDYHIGRWRVNALHLDAVLFGIGAGLAILTRIMAVPFVVAGAGWILLGRRAAWRQHARGLGIAALTATIVAAPYFINCWRVFGDPLYTFNVHGAIYSVTEHRPELSGSTASYVRAKIARRPMQAVDTIARGITTYPFENKFHGLNPWLRGIDRWLAGASLAGLVVLAGFPAGRLLLVTTMAGLLPFSLTWTLDPDYRFTLFAYPVLLIAAGVAMSAAARVLAGRPGDAPTWRTFAWRPWGAQMAAALAMLWFVYVVSPSLVAVEALHDGDDVSLIAGDRDTWTFGRGWSNVIGSVNVRSRAVTNDAVIHLLLPDSADYGATVRMDPFPKPLDDQPAKLPTVEFVLNGATVATTMLRPTTDRVGAYDIVLPKSVVRRGFNDLVVRVVRASPAGPLARPGLSEGDAASVWFVRLHPPVAGQPDGGRR